MLCIGSVCAQHTLDTLEHIKAYLDTVPEAPAPDGENWFNPSFYYFFKSQESSVMERMQQWLGLRAPSWDARELERMLETVTNERKDVTLTSSDEGEPSQTYAIPHNASCIVWGDLYGAIHSLYRGLNELYEQGKIDNELHLKDETYLVFLGNTINRSPYSVHMLTMILHLMHRNPDRVIYIRGHHETDAYWTNFVMREELQRKASHLSDEAIPLHSSIDAFFATLPRAVYMHPQGAPDEVVYLSYHGQDVHEKTIDPDDLHDIKRIVASIRGEPRHMYMQDMAGLELLGFTYGAPEWSVFSAPVWTYQQFFDVTYDAFALIQFGSSIDTSRISLFNRHIDSSNKRFSVAHTYDVTSGQELDTYDASAVRDQFTSLSIGSTIGISRGLGMQGQSVERGISVAVNHANKTGGVNAYMLRPFIFDDAYMPHRASQNVDHLLNDFNVNLIIAPTGTPTLQAYDQQVRKQEGAVLFPVTGSPVFRSQDHPRTVHFRPSYVEEARALTQHVIDTYKTRKMVFFYQDDEFGRPLRDAAIQVLQDNGIQDWLDVAYLQGQVDFARQAQQIREYNPSTIGFFATSSASQELIRKLTSTFLIGKPLFGNSDLGEYSFRQFIKQQGVRCSLALAVPDPEKSTLPIAQEFRARMDRLGWPYDVFAFEGYIAVQVLAESLRSLSREFSVDAMLTWFEALNQYQFKGLELTFDPATRSLSQPVAIQTITADQ